MNSERGNTPDHHSTTQQRSIKTACWARTKVTHTPLSRQPANHGKRPPPVLAAHSVPEEPLAGSEWTHAAASVRAGCLLDKATVRSKASTVRAHHTHTHSSAVTVPLAVVFKAVQGGGGWVHCGVLSRAPSLPPGRRYLLGPGDGTPGRLWRDWRRVGGVCVSE